MLQRQRDLASKLRGSTIRPMPEPVDVLDNWRNLGSDVDVLLTAVETQKDSTIVPATVRSEPAPQVRSSQQQYDRRVFELTGTETKRKRKGRWWLALLSPLAENWALVKISFSACDEVWNISQISSTSLWVIGTSERCHLWAAWCRDDNTQG